MCNDITNVAINESQQKTERMKIRAANQVLITKIEADSANFRLALEKSEAERANLIHCVCELMSKPDIPQEQLVFVKYILTYLDNTNPMNYLK